MRKVTEEAYSAFVDRQRYNKGNTTVTVKDGEVYMYLFGNLIAKTENGEVWINHCGYTTSTTQERLNAFNVNIRKHKDKFIVNEKFIWREGWLNLNNLD